MKRKDRKCGHKDDARYSNGEGVPTSLRALNSITSLREIAASVKPDATIHFQASDLLELCDEIIATIDDGAPWAERKR